MILYFEFCDEYFSYHKAGSMTQLTNYHQFDGTIQVIKAVGNHLVLTFCEMLPKSNLFTVVLTKRLHDLSRDVSKNLFIQIYIIINILTFFQIGNSIDKKSFTSSRIECSICKKSLQKFSFNEFIEFCYNYDFLRFIDAESKGLKTYNIYL